MQNIKIIKQPEALALVGIVALSLFFHLYNLGYGEFSNDETIAATYTIYFLHGFIKPVYWGSLLIFPHPPLRILVNIPFVLLCGASETVMRLPHALFGGLATVPLYLSGRALYGHKTAILAGLMYAVSGTSAINSEAQGVGIYLFFVLLTFYFVINFVTTDHQQYEGRYILLASVSLILATYTYLEAVVFIFPVAYMVFQKKRELTLKHPSIRNAGIIYIAGLMTYFLIWSIMPTIAHNLGYINNPSAGNLEHILERASGLFAFNVRLITVQYMQYNSIFMVLLLMVGIVAGGIFLRSTQSFQMNLLYVLPHLIVWTFLLKNIVFHVMYDFPLIALLAAAGLIALLDWLKTHNPALKQAVLVSGVVFIALSGWHHYLAHNQDVIPFSREYLVFGETTNRPHRTGAKTAGYYIRKHSYDVTDQIFVYDNVLNANYYAGRLDKNHSIREGLADASIQTMADLKEAIAKSPNWPNVSFLVMNKDNHLIWDYATQNYLLEAVITEKGQPEKYIFNARKTADNDTLPLTMAAEQYDPQYDQEYTDWRQVIPWFLVAAEQRL